MCRRRADVFGEAPGQGMHMTQTPNSPDNPAQPTTVQPTAAGVAPAAGQAGSPSAANYGGQPPVASAPPPEGWQAGYEKMKQRSTYLLISTIALGVTTVLAGMLAVGMGALAVSNSDGPGDGPGGRHSQMDGDRGGRGGMNGNGYNGQGRLNPTPAPTTSVAPTATPAPTATAKPTP